jgi:hypothetical protein
MIMFATYTSLRPASPTSNENVPNFYAGVFAAGFGSGVLLMIFSNPLDVWRTRLMTNYESKPKPKGEGVLASLFKPEQRGLLMRGMSMTAVRNLPGNGIFFTLHEFSLRQCKSNNGFGIQSEHLQRLLCGGCTGIVFNLLLYPFDVVKSRMMITAPSDGGAFNMARALYQEAGVAGFWRGASVTTLKAFPVNAAGFWALHASQTLLGVSNKGSDT